MKGTFNELVDLLHTSVLSRRPLVIVGPPGIGKSSAPRQYVEAMNSDVPEGESMKWGYVAVDCYMLEPVDLRGFQVPDIKNRTTVSLPMEKFPFARYVAEGKIPERGICVLEELMSSHDDMKKALAEPLLEHTINGEPLAPGWSIIATGNGLAHKCGAGPLPMHVVNRLAWFELVPTWEEWNNWAVDVAIRPELVGHFALTNGATLFEFDAKALSPNQPYLTPRSAHMLSDLLNSYEEAFGKAAPCYLYQSAVGEKAGSELFSTTRWVSQLTKWDNVLADPNGSKVPEEPGAVFAQITILRGGVRGLGTDIKPKVSAAVDTYLRRLPAEVFVAAHNSIMRSSPDRAWSRTPEYAKMVQEKARVL